MSTKTYFSLYFEKVKDGQLPHTPISIIEVKHLSSTIDGKGIGALSPNCVNANEIAYYADRMIKELEEIKKEAKQKYTNGKGCK